MKKKIALLLALALILTFTSCKGEIKVKKGIYFLKDEKMGPYIFFDPENQDWHSARGIAISFARAGTYSQSGDQITANGADSRETAMVFQILSEEEIRVISVNEAFFPEGNRWINEGETYVFWAFGDMESGTGG